MRSAVRSHFVTFNSPLEGVLPFMYTDSAPSDANPSGNVTTAMGYLLPTPESATELPWRLPGGALADAATVMAAWQTVHDGPFNSSSGAGPLTSIRLDAAGIQAATDKAIDSSEAILRSQFPTYDRLNAYAQLALWSMRWALGPAFRTADGFTQFGAAIDAGNFAAAAAPTVYGATNPAGQSLGHYQGSGSAPRIAANDQLWLWAQQVADVGGDPDLLSVGWSKLSNGALQLTGGPGFFGRLPMFPIVALVAGAGWVFRDSWLPYARAGWHLIRKAVTS